MQYIRSSISIIVPTLNEAENIPLLFEHIHNSLQGANIPYEIIRVEGSSAGATVAMAQPSTTPYPARTSLGLWRSRVTKRFRSGRRWSRFISQGMVGLVAFAVLGLGLLASPPAYADEAPTSTPSSRAPLVSTTSDHKTQPSTQTKPDSSSGSPQPQTPPPTPPKNASQPSASPASQPTSSGSPAPVTTQNTNPYAPQATSGSTDQPMAMTAATQNSNQNTSAPTGGLHTSQAQSADYYPTHKISPQKTNLYLNAALLALKIGAILIALGLIVAIYKAISKRMPHRPLEA